jgi:hypothetical protein
VADWKRPVVIGVRALGLRHEAVPGHLAHCLEHRRVSDAARFNLLAHHVEAFLLARLGLPLVGARMARALTTGGDYE